MAIYPRIQAYDGAMETIDVFGGLNTAEKISEGEWSSELNMSADRYPMLSVRGKRSVIERYEGAIISALEKEKLWILWMESRVFESDWYPNNKTPADLVCWVTDNNANVRAAELHFHWPDEWPTGMVSFGAYIIVLGINQWFNTATGETGRVETGWHMQESDSITLSPCADDGTPLTVRDAFPHASQGTTIENDPESTYQNGDCYTAADEKLIRQKTESGWVTLKNITRIDARSIDSALKVTAGGKVKLSGFTGEELTGEKAVYAKGDGYVCVGEAFCAESTVSRYDGEATEHPAVVTGMPQMDYIVESQNRLWGCFYGEKDGKAINEIYASELGDFTSWYNYDGTSMASYAASVGTDGAWTGAVSFQGRPHFFKENCVHKVYISAAGAHQIVDTPLAGVQNGCGSSLCALGGNLYYMSREGVCRYDGSTPVTVSDALGKIRCEYASFGGFDAKLYAYIYRYNDDDTTSDRLYTFDTKHGIWHEEKAIEGRNGSIAFGRRGDSFCAINAGMGHFTPVHSEETIWTPLLDLTGTEGATEEEEDIVWNCTSGLIGWQNVEQKYISRFDLRLTLPVGARMTVSIEYDSSGTWEEQGTVTGGGTGSIMIPVRPRRCDHFRIRLNGRGEMRMFSMAKRLLKGSDVVR